jgi:prepilin-type processing-associated H-X9-DG protein
MLIEGHSAMLDWARGGGGWAEYSVNKGDKAFCGGNNIDFIHAKNANVLFCDGHVGKLPYQMSTKKTLTTVLLRQEMRYWSNSPNTDGGAWNRMGTAAPADDVYVVNACPRNRYGWGGALNEDGGGTGGFSTIWDIDMSYGDFNTKSRPQPQFQGITTGVAMLGPAPWPDW